MSGEPALGECQLQFCVCRLTTDQKEGLWCTPVALALGFPKDSCGFKARLAYKFTRQSCLSPGSAVWDTDGNLRISVCKYLLDPPKGSGFHAGAFQHLSPYLPPCWTVMQKQVGRWRLVGRQQVLSANGDLRKPQRCRLPNSVFFAAGRPEVLLQIVLCLLYVSLTSYVSR